MSFVGQELLFFFLFPTIYRALITRDTQRELVSSHCTINENPGSFPTVLTTHTHNHPPTHETTQTHTRRLHLSKWVLLQKYTSRQRDKAEFQILNVGNKKKNELLKKEMLEAGIKVGRDKNLRKHPKC